MWSLNFSTRLLETHLTQLRCMRWLTTKDQLLLWLNLNMIRFSEVTHQLDGKLMEHGQEIEMHLYSVLLKRQSMNSIKTMSKPCTMRAHLWFGLDMTFFCIQTAIIMAVAIQILALLTSLLMEWFKVRTKQIFTWQDLIVSQSRR